MKNKNKPLYTADPALDAVTNVKGDIKKVWKVLDGLRDGKEWYFTDNGQLGVIHDLSGDHVKLDFATLEDIIHMLILTMRTREEEEDIKQSAFDQLTKTEEQRDELVGQWEHIAKIINDLPSHLPYKYQPSWMKR